MISLKKILEEAIDMPQAEIQPAENFSSDFIEFVKNLENAAKAGFRDGRWYPHKSFEGGLPTIAWGHKIQAQDELRRLTAGITDGEAEKLLKKDLEQAQRVVKQYMSKLGVKIPLSSKQSEMLTEFAFNLGSLDKFPKFTKAVLNGDWAAAKKECRRFANGTELTRRNKLFQDRYLK